MLDLDELCEALGLEKEEFKEFGRLFTEVARKDLEEIHRALVKGNLDCLAQAAHSLKGAASTLNLQGIFTLARELERRAKAGQALELGGFFQALKKEVEQLAELLNEQWQDQQEGVSSYLVSSGGDEL